MQVSTPNWTQAIHCRCQICSQQDCHRHFQARFVPLSLLPTLLQSALAWDFGLERCIMLSRIWRDIVFQKLGAQVLPAGAWRCSFWFSYYQCLRDQVFRFGPRVHPSAWFANIWDARWWVRVSDQSVWAFWRSGVAIVLLKSTSTVHRSHGCICTFCIFCTEEADIHLVNRCEVVQHVIESIITRETEIRIIFGTTQQRGWKGHSACTWPRWKLRPRGALADAIDEAHLDTAWDVGCAGAHHLPQLKSTYACDFQTLCLITLPWLLGWRIWWVTEGWKSKFQDPKISRSWHLQVAPLGFTFLPDCLKGSVGAGSLATPHQKMPKVMLR